MVFIANNKVNARNKWTDQKYIDEKLRCINILCNIFSRFKNSYFNEIKFAYCNNLTSLNKSILIYLYYIDHQIFKANTLFPPKSLLIYIIVLYVPSIYDAKNYIWK